MMGKIDKQDNHYIQSAELQKDSDIYKKPLPHSILASGGCDISGGPHEYKRALFYDPMSGETWGFVCQICNKQIYDHLIFGKPEDRPKDE